MFKFDLFLSIKIKFLIGNDKWPFTWAVIYGEPDRGKGMVVPLSNYNSWVGMALAVLCLFFTMVKPSQY